jgi:uncharacterized protein YneF (UPF0154 family)
MVVAIVVSLIIGFVVGALCFRKNAVKFEAIEAVVKDAEKKL